MKVYNYVESWRVQNRFGPVGSVLIPSVNPVMLVPRLFVLVG